MKLLPLSILVLALVVIAAEAPSTNKPGSTKPGGGTTKKPGGGTTKKPATTTRKPSGPTPDPSCRAKGQRACYRCGPGLKFADKCSRASFRSIWYNALQECCSKSCYIQVQDGITKRGCTSNLQNQNICGLSGVECCSTDLCNSATRGAAYLWSLLLLPIATGLLKH